MLMHKEDWYLVHLQEEKALHILLPMCSSNDSTVGRDLLILGRWLDNSSGQTLAKLMPCWEMVMCFISHFYAPGIQLQTPNPSSAVGDLDVSVSSASESIFLLPMQCTETSRTAGLQHGAIQAPCCSCAKSLRAQIDRITSKSGQVPISPPDDRLVQGDTRHVRKCRQIISGQTRLKSCKSCKNLSASPVSVKLRAKQYLDTAWYLCVTSSDCFHNDPYLLQISEHYKKTFWD